MDHLGFEILRVARLMGKQHECSAVEQDLERMTGTKSYILGYLFHHTEQDIFQRDIEKEFSVSRSGVTATLKKMEENGLIKREGVSQDARLKRIILTKKAKEINNRIEAELAERENLLTCGISVEEQKIFLEILGKMRKNLEKSEKKERQE